MDEDLIAWATRQTADVKIAVPERMPGEPDATPDQVKEIASFAGTAAPRRPAETLGTWQAAYVIQRLREERRDLAERVAVAAQQVQAQRDGAGCVWTALILVILGIAMWFIFSF